MSKIIRVEKTSNYTVMGNWHLKDDNLSLRAKGLLSLVLSLPDDWGFSKKGLKCLTQESEVVLNKTLKELEAAGYFKMNKLTPDKTQNGRFEYEYVFYEKPQKQGIEKQGIEKQGIEKQGIEKQGIEKQGIEKQGIEKLGLYKYTNILNTKELNTKELNTKDISFNKKNSKSSKNKGKNKPFIPPTLKEVEDYCLEKGYHIDPQFFIEYYEALDWCDKKGNPVKNWKIKLLIWERKNTNYPTSSDDALIM